VVAAATVASTRASASYAAAMDLVSGRRRPVLSALIVVAASIFAGCDGITSGQFLSPEGCTERATFDAELHVDPEDERWIWAIDRATGQVISLRIPDGYGVQTQPAAVIDASGAVIGRTGDRIQSGCVDAIQNAVMIDEQDIVPAS
jgi:hypothetical protein